jgi:hypothetical protein
MLAWAVGLAPFKDNFWSSAQQPGSSCGPNATEITPSLHNAISTFSASTVSPSDGVGLSDVPQIMRACTKGGLLLHPSRPLTAIDKQVTAGVFPSSGPSGSVYATYSYVSGWAFDSALAAELTSPYALTLSDLLAIRADLATRGNAPPPLPTIVYSLDADTLDISTLTIAAFSDAAPFSFSTCKLADFKLAHFSSTFANGYALLGDLTKWVPVAEARFSNIVVSGSSVSVLV